MSGRDTWTDYQLRRLVELIGIGKTFEETGQIIGKSKNACIGKLRRCVEASDALEVG